MQMKNESIINHEYPDNNTFTFLCQRLSVLQKCIKFLNIQKERTIEKKETMC